MKGEEKLEHENRLLKNELDQLKREGNDFASKPETILLGEHVPPFPPDYLRATVSTSSFMGFLFLGDLWHHLISKFLKKGSVLMDVGCGCGKMARNLIDHPYVEGYIGFDVYKPNIDWCVKYLTPFSKDRFQFFHYDVYSQTFNSKGKIKVEEVVFPAKDSSVDLVIAGSLYTHILEEDAKHYLKETARVLKPGGQFIPSIHNQPKAGSYFSGDELKVDIDSDYFIKMVQKEKMQVDQKLGMLAGQEVFLFKKS